MATNTKRGFNSTFGAIMAAAGSAMGLGNMWRFPYICGKYGGGAFLMVYIFFIFAIGMVLMMSEFIIGRRTRQSPLRAFITLKPQQPKWRIVGVLGLLTCFLVLAVYLVISGWTVNYFWESLTGQLSAVGDGAYESHFMDFASSAIAPVVCLLIFLAINVVVVLGGVEKGIERVSKLLMPVMVVLLAILCVRSLTLEGASEGLRYLFYPDFNFLSGEGVLAALGQALFSLSVGLGVMIVYGSYLPAKDNLLTTSLWIVVCDLSVSILAGIAIFPAVFSCGLTPAEGPGLVYQVLPVVFNSMGSFGRVAAILFFLLLALAALTSAISLLEALTAGLSEGGMKRGKAVALVSIGSAVLASLASFSFGNGLLSNWHLFVILDKLTGTYMLAIGALLTVIFVGWFMKRDDIYDELSNHGTLKVGYFKVFYYFLIRVLAPIALLVVLIAGIVG
ncbi:MAG: sodium-dependent transporter [Bacteroidales bacterium]|nr:sodium-dependent transporter [Bacteroidales bacterium]